MTASSASGLDSIDSRLSLYVSVIFIVSVLGAIVLPRISQLYSHYLHYVNSMAGATLFATAILHLVPELREHALTDYPFDMLILCGTWIGLMFFEKVIFHVHHHAPELHLPSGGGNCSVFIQNMIGVVAIGLHSIIAGIALGGSDTTADLDSVFVSIISHKLFAALAIGSRVLTLSSSGGDGIKSIFSWPIVIPLALFCLMTPIGALIGWLINDSNEWLDMVLDSISAGTFLYMGSIDMMDEHEAHHHEGQQHQHGGSGDQQQPDDDDQQEASALTVGRRCDEGDGEVGHADHHHSINKYGQFIAMGIGIGIIAIVNSFHGDDAHGEVGH